MTACLRERDGVGEERYACGEEKVRGESRAAESTTKGLSDGKEWRDHCGPRDETSASEAASLPLEGREGEEGVHLGRGGRGGRGGTGREGTGRKKRRLDAEASGGGHERSPRRDGFGDRRAVGLAQGGAGRGGVSRSAQRGKRLAEGSRSTRSPRGRRRALARRRGAQGEQAARSQREGASGARVAGGVETGKGRRAAQKARSRARCFRVSARRDGLTLCLSLTTRARP